jgi:hypothetical protein
MPSESPMIKTAFGFVLLALALSTQSDGATIVVPPIYANAEGPVAAAAQLSGTRAYHAQDVFSSAYFPANGPTTITGMRFRPDAGWTSAATVSIPSIDFRLSATSRGPGTLSTVFSENIGPDEILVRSGALTYSTLQNGPTSKPNVFDILVPFQTPFVYDPSQGHLLIDIRKMTGTTLVSGPAFPHFDYFHGEPGTHIEYGGGPGGFDDATANALFADRVGFELPVVAFDIQETLPISDIPPEYQPLTQFGTSYTLAVVDNTIEVGLTIRLIGDDPGDALINIWKTGIESIWSTRYTVIDGTYTYPLHFYATFLRADEIGPADVMVEVTHGDGSDNMRHWYTGSPARNVSVAFQDRAAAHEFGHMLGLYDDNPQSTIQNPVNPRDDNTSIMAGVHGIAKPYHYEAILEWLGGKTGRQMILGNLPGFDDPLPGEPFLESEFEIEPVPEPNAFTIMLTALFVVPVSMLLQGQRPVCLHLLKSLRQPLDDVAFP